MYQSIRGEMCFIILFQFFKGQCKGCGPDGNKCAFMGPSAVLNPIRGDQSMKLFFETFWKYPYCGKFSSNIISLSTIPTRIQFFLLLLISIPYSHRISVSRTRDWIALVRQGECYSIRRSRNHFQCLARSQVSSLLIFI